MLAVKRAYTVGSKAYQASKRMPISSSAEGWEKTAEAIKQLEDQVSKLIPDIASVETGMQVLGVEVEATTTKISAIEKVDLPRIGGRIAGADSLAKRLETETKDLEKRTGVVQKSTDTLSSRIDEIKTTVKKSAEDVTNLSDRAEWINKIVTALQEERIPRIEGRTLTIEGQVKVFMETDIPRIWSDLAVLQTTKDKLLEKLTKIKGNIEAYRTSIDGFQKKIDHLRLSLVLLFVVFSGIVMLMGYNLFSYINELAAAKAKTDILFDQFQKCKQQLAYQIATTNHLEELKVGLLSAIPEEIKRLKKEYSSCWFGSRSIKNKLDALEAAKTLLEKEDNTSGSVVFSLKECYFRSSGQDKAFQDKYLKDVTPSPEAVRVIFEGMDDAMQKVKSISDKPATPTEVPARLYHVALPSREALEIALDLNWTSHLEDNR